MTEMRRTEHIISVLFDLNCGEKRPSVVKDGFTQSLCQSVFDFFPVGSGEVALELEQGRNMFHTAGERREGEVKNNHFNPNNIILTKGKGTEKEQMSMSTTSDLTTEKSGSGRCDQ